MSRGLVGHCVSVGRVLAAFERKPMSSLTVLRVTPGSEMGGTLDPLTDRSAVSVIDVDSVAAAEQTIAEGNADCLVTEYDLPDGTGIELIESVRETAPDTGCILFTDADREAIVAETGGRLVTEYVDKASPAAQERLADLVTTTARRSTQTAYPLPGDEAERLAALERLDVESPSLRRALDRVADLASEHFAVDRTAVNVIAKHVQEVLASCGADWTSFVREDTICTYAILDEGVTVIPDTRTDPRFRASEDLEEANIRFYAGVPLTTDDGLAIGTLCVYDEHPRDLSAGEQHYLELLADEAMQWIDVHSRLSYDREDASRGVDLQ